MEAYLLLLKDYHSAITYHSADGRDEISKHADKLKYKNVVSNISGHFFESTLKTERSKSSWNPWSKDPDDRVESPMNDLYYHESEVDYYTNARSADIYQNSENEKLIDERANYTSNFITKEIIGKLIGSLKQPAGTALNTAIKVAEYDSGERKLDSDIKVGGAREYANILSMEFIVSQSHTVPGKAVSSETKVQLQPTQESYEVIKRWKKVHAINSDIPYPEEHIQTQDWKEIGKTLTKLNSEFQGADLTNLYDYITDGSSNSRRSVEELAIVMTNHYYLYFSFKLTVNSLFHHILTATSEERFLRGE